MLLIENLSIIIATHQSVHFIEDEVFSVVSRALKYSVEQIIITHASTNGTAEVLDQLSSMLKQVIKNPLNIGFISRS